MQGTESRNPKWKRKLFAYSWFVLVFFVAAGYVAFETPDNATVELQIKARQYAASAHDAQVMRVEVQKLSKLLWTMYGVSAGSEFSAAREQAFASMDKFDKTREEFKPDASVSGLYASVPARWENVKTIAEKAVAEFAKNRVTSHEAGKRMLTEKLQPEFAAIEETFAAMEAESLEHSLQGFEHAKAHRQATVPLALGALGTLALGFGLMWIFRLTTPIRSIATRLRAASHYLAVASSRLASANRALAKDAIARHAALAEGMAYVSDVEGEIQKLAQQNKDAVERCNRNASALKALDSISSQASMIALDAAIEGARAGENGKAFSVIADALKTLSENCERLCETLSESIRNATADTKENTSRIEFSLSSMERALEFLRTSDGEGSFSPDRVALASEQLSSAAQSLESMVKALVLRVGEEDSKIHAAPPKRVSREPLVGNPPVRGAQKKDAA